MPSNKVKRKAGWKVEKEQHDAWLAKHKPTPAERQRLEAARRAQVKLPSKIPRNPRLYETKVNSVEIKPDDSVLTKVHDPRVLYKDNPEMLERELEARERKFNTAPMYNKGGDQYVTEEMMKDIMSGATRRRN